MDNHRGRCGRKALLALAIMVGLVIPLVIMYEMVQSTLQVMEDQEKRLPRSARKKLAKNESGDNEFYFEHYDGTTTAPHARLDCNFADVMIMVCLIVLSIQVLSIAAFVFRFAYNKSMEFIWKFVSTVSNLFAVFHGLNFDSDDENDRGEYEDLDGYIYELTDDED